MISGSLSPQYAHPQVVDGGMVSSMEGSCKYIESAVVDSRQGVVLQLGGWVRFYQLFIVKTSLVMVQMHVPWA